MDEPVLNGFVVVDGGLNIEEVEFAKRDGEVFAENAPTGCPNDWVLVDEENGLGVVAKGEGLGANVLAAIG